MYFQKMVLLIMFYVTIVCGNNLTEWSVIRRSKRGLIYHNGAVLKFVGGITFPVPLYDHAKYRQLVTAYNLQAQYSLPTTAQQLQPPWTGKTLEAAKINYEKFNKYANDESRNFVYTLIEVYIEKNGQNGRQCLQKAICENAQIDATDGIFAEIIHTILTPSALNSPADYLEAFEAGKAGAECRTLFPQCEHGASFLDKILMTHNK